MLSLLVFFLFLGLQDLGPAWGLSPAPSLTGEVTLGQSFYCLESQFPDLETKGRSLVELT